jgi:hypothetical protein
VSQYEHLKSLIFNRSTYHRESIEKMTFTEQQAFIKAFDKHVNTIDTNDVEDFITKLNNGEEIRYSSSKNYTIIVDALGMWHEGVRFALTNKGTEQ